MNKGHPNLFDFATHELSQDAVLIWLIRYADQRFQEDIELHKVAKKFLGMLLGRTDIEIKTVECWKQWENIDITVNVNNKFGIILEDKKGANLHGNQLRHYRASATKWAKKDNLELCFVYLNTENPNTEDRDSVAKEGYEIVNRRDLLRVLSEYQGDNVILRDYREKLEQFETETKAYLSLPYYEWNGRAWQGFYDWIHEVRPNSTWMWLNNMGGGFWSTWWGNHEGWIKDEVSLYPQIDQGRFSFKMYGEGDNNRDWGYKLRDKIEYIAEEMGIKEIRRPARMSFKGCATTLLVVEPKDYLGTERIDLKAISERFAMYESIILKCRDCFS